MSRLWNIAMRDYQVSVTTGQTDGQTDARQSDPYVPLCFAGDIKTNNPVKILICSSIITWWSLRRSLMTSISPGIGSWSSPTSVDSALFNHARRSSKMALLRRRVDNPSASFRPLCLHMPVSWNYQHDLYKCTYGPSSNIHIILFTPGTRGPKGHISCTWVQCATRAAILFFRSARKTQTW